MEHKIKVAPKDFNKNLSKALISQLKTEVLGMVIESHGKLIAITKLLTSNAGIVQHNEGTAIYRIKFEALFFKLEKGAVIDGVVYEILQNGILANVGPKVKVFISSLQVPEGYTYDGTTQSFIMKLQGKATSKQIQTGTQLRMRILDINPKKTDLGGMATINEPSLGPIETEE